MYRFDASRQPLFVAQASGVVSPAEIDQMGADLEAMLLRRASYAIVWDFAQAEFPARATISQAMAMTKRVRQLSQDLYERVSPPIPAFSAYYLNPRIVRLLNFFERILPDSDVPTGFYETQAAAIAGAEQALERMGLRAGPRSGVGS